MVALAEEFIGYVKAGTWTQHGWPTFGYAVSKNLLNSYSRVLARDFERQGVRIRVNAVHPGWVRTDMAGQEAELSIEEGSELPVRVIRDTTEITGKFWSNGNHYDYF